MIDYHFQSILDAGLRLKCREAREALGSFGYYHGSPDELKWWQWRWREGNRLEIYLEGRLDGVGDCMLGGR